MKKKMIEIDGGRLKELVAKRGWTLSGASEQMGMNETYLNGVIREGKISIPSSLLIDRMLNIPLEEYEQKGPEQLEFDLGDGTSEKAALPFTIEELEEAIFRAAERAFRGFEYRMEQREKEKRSRFFDDEEGETE